MSTSTPTKTVGTTLKPRLVVGTIVLWLAYVVVYTWHPGDALAAVLEFLPGILGVGLFIAAGFRPEDCYLRLAPISRTGLAMLAAFFLFLIPILLTGQWSGWNWASALVYAPASGIAQELFFRATLLPLFMNAFRERTLLAVSLHSVLFALWHGPLAFRTAPLPGAIAVVVVTFLGGVIWGWQAQHDRTVAWTMTHHTLYLMVMSLFVWE